MLENIKYVNNYAVVIQNDELFILTNILIENVV